MLFRKLTAAAALAATLAIAGAPTSALATAPYDDGDAHPLRILGFLVAPAGYLAEWLVTRPLQRIVSQDDLAPVFSYTPQSGFDYETYTEGLSTGVSFEQPDLGTKGYWRHEVNPGIGVRRPPY